MIEEVIVTGARGVRRGSVCELTPVTVLTGPSGSGKTSVLEAFAEEVNEPDVLRFCWGTDALESLCGADLNFNYHAAKNQPEREKEVIRLVRNCQGMSGFTGVHVLQEKPEGSVRRTYATFEGGERIEPVNLGQGRWRLVKMAYAFAAFPHEGGMLLLDCPEVYQSPSGIQAVTELIAHAVCSWKVQCILATQSLELINWLTDELEEKGRIDDLSLFRLRLTDEGSLRSVSLTGEQVKLAREALLTDLRE